jgi:hypothetical protein
MGDFFRRKWPILAVSTLALGLTLVLLIPSTANAAALCRKDGARRLTMAQAQTLARKWGRIRGIPASWILATIFVESGRDACKRGDFNVRGVNYPRGASVGLMQVNTVAHPDVMEKLGLSREDLFDPDKAVELGSYILAQEYQQILAWLGGRRPPVPIGVIVQLAYKGNKPQIRTALQRGVFDAEAIHGPEVLARRSSALVEAEALV